MDSIQFPNMFNRTVTNTVSDYYATLQNLKMLLWSEKGELFGDPYFGTGLKKYLYEQNTDTDTGHGCLKDILIDDIYTAIATFMPQLYLTRKDIDIKISGNKAIITISAINRSDFQTNLYNIVLLDTTA